MDSVVTARVPVEVRRQGNEVLRSLGSTPTQLVNAAYEYVIVRGTLPGADSAGSPKPGKRVLSSQERVQLAEFFTATTAPISEEYWRGKTYKQLLEEGRLADYEALA